MTKRKQTNKRDCLSTVICLLVAIGFAVWQYNYEKETKRLIAEGQQEIQKLKEKTDLNHDYIEKVDYQLNYLQDGAPEYLMPADKASVDSIIDAYYAEHPMTAPLQTKSAEKPVQAKKVTKAPTHYVDKKTTKKKPVATTQKKQVTIGADLNTVVEYIKEKEKFNAKAYRDGCLVKAKRCPRGKERYSVGYGTLAKSRTEVVTKAEAERRLTVHIKQTIYPKLQGVRFKSVSQMHASIDFAYNAGHNAFANNIVTSTKEVDCVKMTEYVNFNGRENEGLKRRRFENFIQCVTVEG